MLKGLSSSAGMAPVSLGTETPKGASGKGESNQDLFAEILTRKAPKPSEPPNEKTVTKEKQATGTKAEVKTEAKAEAKEESGEPKRSEEKAEKTQTKAKKAEGKSARENEAEGSQRQQAMQKFMDSMESEFGIPPTRIVEVMANLSETQLQMPPEETASAVIEQLDLPATQAVKAESMYMKMLADTQPSQLGGAQVVPEFFKPIDHDTAKSALIAAGLTGSALLGRMSAQDRRAHVNAGLEKMNSNFFVNNMGLKDSPASMESTQLGMSEMDPSLLSDPTEGMNLDPSLELNQNIPVQVIDGNKMMNPQNLKSTDDLAAAMQALERAAQGLGEATSKLPATEVATESLPSLKAETGLQALAGSALGVQMASSDSEESGKEFSGDTSGQSPGQEFFLNRDKNPLDGKIAGPNGNQAAGAAAGFSLTQLSRQEKTENIQKIMDQAQVMAKKGGGSMRLQMTPEGLGSIDLRVRMLNGKLDLQVQTETKEAKQLLESSLGELKHSLASQKIHVDNVKVDVGLDSRDNQQNMQQNRQFGSEDSAREQARQFLGQFRQSNSEGRSGFLEMGGMKAYMPKKKEEHSPIVETQARKQVAHKGNGINLVA